MRAEWAVQAVAVILQRENALSIARRAAGAEPAVAAPLASARHQLSYFAAARAGSDPAMPAGIGSQAVGNALYGLQSNGGRQPAPMAAAGSQAVCNALYGLPVVPPAVTGAAASSLSPSPTPIPTPTIPSPAAGRHCCATDACGTTCSSSLCAPTPAPAQPRGRDLRVL